MRELLEIHSRVTRVAATTSSTVDLLREVVRQGAELVGVERCGAYMRDEREELFRARAACAKGVALGEDVRRWRAGVPADGLTSEAVATREPVIVADAQQDPRMIKAAVSRWSIRSIMAVPMVFDSEVIGLLMMDDIGRRRDFGLGDVETARAFADFAAATVAQTEERLSLRHRLGLVRRELTAARRGAELDEQLGHLVREGRSLEEIAARAADLLDKPCAVYRDDGARVAAAAPGSGALPSPGGPLEQGLLDLPEVRDALAGKETDRAVLLGPIASARLRRRHAVAPVMVGEELWGRLVVMETTTPLSGTELGAVRRAATLIGLRVKAERQGAGERWEEVSSLTADLLRASASPAELRSRATRLGVSLDAKRVVALFAWPEAGEDEEEMAPREVELALRQRLPGFEIHVAALAGAVAAMIRLPADGDAAAFLARHREDLEAVRLGLRPAAPPIAAVSDEHRWAGGYRDAHREARRVLECIRRFATDEGPRLLAARDLGGGGSFLAGSDGEAMSRFAEETIGRLLDEESNADLVLTLRAYFESLCSVRATATALGVHENTVRYRLSRVEEETGLAVMRDPDAQVGARLALLILVLRGRFPAAPAPAAGGDETPPRE